MKTSQPTNTPNKKRKKHLAFLVCNEDDFLDWDAHIGTPPPRPSGTIRVKLKYKGRRKPIPIENFWEE